MSGGGGFAVETSKPGSVQSDKQIKKEIRKIVKSTLSKLLTQSLVPDKREKVSNKISSISLDEDNLNECVNFFGILTNSITKEYDLIFGARIEYFGGGPVAFYVTDNPKLFTSYPAPATYQGPYKDSKKIFVEVFARMDDKYICKAIDQLKYLELLSMKGEKNG